VGGLGDTVLGQRWIRGAVDDGDAARERVADQHQLHRA
jgi:hypothetical protein